jgi:hypothetical protein
MSIKSEISSYTGDGAWTKNQVQSELLFRIPQIAHEVDGFVYTL